MVAYVYETIRVMNTWHHNLKMHYIIIIKCDAYVSKQSNLKQIYS